MIFDIKQIDYVDYGMIAVCSQFSDEHQRKEDRKHGNRDTQLVPRLRSSNQPQQPRSASTRREPLSLNLETLSSIHGLRSEGHGAWPSDKGSGFRQDINKSIYDRPSVTAARIEHYNFLQSSNEHGNNSEHKKATSNLRRLSICYYDTIPGCGGRI